MTEKLLAMSNRLSQVNDWYTEKCLDFLTKVLHDSKASDTTRKNATQCLHNVVDVQNSELEMKILTLIIAINQNTWKMQNILEFQTQNYYNNNAQQLEFRCSNGETRKKLEELAK